MARTFRVGLSKANFDIPHHEIWDSFLPLMFLTRNGGPLYGKGFRQAIVTAAYALNAQVAEFFAARSQSFGLTTDVVSPVVARTYDVRTAGDAVLFGGGTDSRLLLGTLRETGTNPLIVCAGGATFAADIPDALTFTIYDSTMAAKIVPALMLCPERVYIGTGLGEAHINQPWQQYFDISSVPALRGTSALLASLGFDIKLSAPQNILPYNIVQKILSVRYPLLAAGQVSVLPHTRSEKNLQVTLLKHYHDLDASGHCTPDLFDLMLADFLVATQTSGDDSFGLNRHREIIHLEMRSIIFRLVQRGKLTLSPDMTPPADWDAPWIDRIHSYINPDTPPGLLSIYRDYADLWPVGAPGLPKGLSNYLEQHP